MDRYCALLEFARAENIREFKRRLKAETDPDKRRVIQRLLAEASAGVLPSPSPEDLAGSDEAAVRNCASRD